MVAYCIHRWSDTTQARVRVRVRARARVWVRDRVRAVIHFQHWSDA